MLAVLFPSILIKISDFPAECLLLSRVTAGQNFSSHCLILEQNCAVHMCVCCACVFGYEEACDVEPARKFLNFEGRGADLAACKQLARQLTIKTHS